MFMNAVIEKIAYIYGDSSQVTTTRLNSYRNTIKELGIQLQPDYLKQGRHLDSEITEKTYWGNDESS